MPIIKVWQSSLKELIELVGNTQKFIFSSLYHTAAIVLGVWLESDWVNQYSICTHSTRLFPHTQGDNNGVWVILGCTKGEINSVLVIE